MKVPIKSCAFITAIVLSSFSTLVLACPNYMKGDYRKLHSKSLVNLCELTEGKALLIVNTASHCGFTSQFKELEALHKKYVDKGLVVIGFASNDFNQEAKDEKEAAGICFLNYGVTFTMLSPTPVLGEAANDVFKALAEQSVPPKWNFNKYLIDKNGQLIKHFDSKVKPNSREISTAIEKVL